MSLRIVSLLPGATEMLVAMGAREQLVGISHECDWPPDLGDLPRVTTTPINQGAASGAIHVAVQEAVAAGRPVIGVDAAMLRRLRPDVLVTQVLCEVCAVADGATFLLVEAMAEPPIVVALQGSTLDGVWADIRTLGDAIGRSAEANAVADALTEMVRAEAARHAHKPRPRVVAIEWLDPLFLAGHWVPEMIAAAGGVDIGGAPGSHSTVRLWTEVMALDPDVVLIMLCGFGIERAREELTLLDGRPEAQWLARKRVAFIDGNAFTSRPGPRLTDGIRKIAEALWSVER